MMQKHPRVVRVVKKVKGHAGHHGGSWKVAYADFVTAMMAFFLVMWIISMDQPLRVEIQNYFNNPFASAQSRAGISTLADGGKSPVGMGYSNGLADPGWRQVANDAQRDRLQEARNRLEREIARRPELAKLARQLSIQVTERGLAIELLQIQEASFFETGSAVPTPSARRLLAIIGRQLGHLPQPIYLEGHTDVQPYRGSPSGYSNWELSTDRANAVRRELEQAGVRPGQVEQVVGLAATRLRDPQNPTSGANRRVTIFVAVRADDKSAVPGPALGGETGRMSGEADRPLSGDDSGPAFRLGIRP
jgi:chemotaxis protein MotB